MKPVYANINLKPGAHTAGIIKVQVAAREWLTANPIIDFNTGKVLTAVTPIPGTNWITLEFAPLTYKYNEKPKSNKGGPYYEISLTGILNNYNADIQQVMESLRYHELVAIVKDKNRLTKIVGTTEAGLVITVLSRIENTSGGQQDATIEMMMESEDPAPYYEP